MPANVTGSPISMNTANPTTQMGNMGWYNKKRNAIAIIPTPIPHVMLALILFRRA